MGDRVKPEPYEIGEDCPFCEEAFWPDDKTPKYLLVSFALDEYMGDCPEDYYSTFNCIQSPGNPCQWSGSAGNFSCFFDLDMEEVWLIGPGARDYFEGDADCWPPYTNTGAECYWGGECTFGVDTKPHEFMYDFGLNPTFGTRYEVYPADDNKLVYRFAQPRTSMNIKVLYDPEA